MEDQRELLDMVAKPGDEDLSLDVDGLTIVDVVVEEGQELLVGTAGGFGRFRATTGNWYESQPGEGNLEETELRIRLTQLSASSFANYVNRLHQWRDQAIPLRLCLAPGRAGTIIATRDEWLPFPSTPYPAVEEQ